MINGHGVPVPLYFLVLSGFEMIDNWIHQRGSFPLPSLAPGFFFCSLLALLPLALLWGLFFWIWKTRKPDSTE